MGLPWVGATMLSAGCGCARQNRNKFPPFLTVVIKDCLGGVHDQRHSQIFPFLHSSRVVLFPGSNKAIALYCRFNALGVTEGQNMTPNGHPARRIRRSASHRVHNPRDAADFRGIDPVFSRYNQGCASGALPAKTGNRQVKPRV